MNILERIPAHALTVDFAVAGQCDTFTDGWIHQKVAPCTIIAQAVEGRYEIETGGSAVITEPYSAHQNGATRAHQNRATSIRE